MKYRAIHRLDEDDLIYELNEAVADGYRVISTGASYNAARGGLEWWAVIERDEKAEKAPKDETAELLEAARKIEAECKKHPFCDECSLYDTRYGTGGCKVWDSPNAWNV